MTPSGIHPNPSLVHSASCEIAVHFIVLIGVLAPVLILVFPSMLLLVGVTMLASASPDGHVAKWIQGGVYAPLALACAVSVTVAYVAVLVGRRKLLSPTFRLRDLAGKDGATLTQMINGMWSRLSPGVPAPGVRWFAAFDIAAYAAARDGKPELHVSNGLWRSAVSGEPIAQAILAHELSHVMHRDPFTLGLLETVVTATRGIMLVTGAFSALVVAYVLFDETSKLILHGESGRAIVLEWLRILAAASTVLLLLPLGWLALRRHVAFITSLIEIRADISAGYWTGGLERYTQIFASSTQVRRTSGLDFLRALLSPSYSHIPQRERLAMLRAPALMITPKTEYFGLSALLIFLLPINFATPLLFGGTLNHLSLQMFSATFNSAIVLMLILGSTSGPIILPRRKLIELAIVSCVVTALPRINLEPISYLAMSWLVGFGGKAADWSALSGDLIITAHDLADKTTAGLINIYTVCAMALAYLGLSMLSRTAAFLSYVKIRCVLGAVTVITCSFIAGFDPSRAIEFPGIVSAEAALRFSPVSYGLALSLPVLSAAVVDGLFYLAHLKFLHRR